MEKVIRWLVERFLPDYHLKLRPKRSSSKPKTSRGKKVIQEKLLDAEQAGEV